jgi:hypothetical protein
MRAGRNAPAIAWKNVQAGLSVHAVGREVGEEVALTRKGAIR